MPGLHAGLQKTKTSCLAHWLMFINTIWQQWLTDTTNYSFSLGLGGPRTFQRTRTCKCLLTALQDKQMSVLAPCRELWHYLWNTHSDSESHNPCTWTVSQSWGKGLKNSFCGPLFSRTFDKSRKNNGQAAKPFLSLLLWGYTTAILTHMLQASTCAWVLAPHPTPSAPKQWKSDVHV